MWEEIFGMALQNGIWATLFIGLMIYILRDSARREAKYDEVERTTRTTIQQLASNLSVVTEIKSRTVKIGRQVTKIESCITNKENNTTQNS